MPPHFDQILEKLNGQIQSYCPKSVIFCYFCPFWGFFTPFDPLGPQRDFFKNPRMSLFNLSKVTNSCKISDNFNGWLRRKIRTNERMDRPQNNSAPPMSQGTKNSIPLDFQYEFLVPLTLSAKPYKNLAENGQNQTKSRVRKILAQK